MSSQQICCDDNKLVYNLLRWLVENDFRVKMSKSGDEFLYLFRFHLANFFSELRYCFDFGDFSFFSKQRNQSVDVLIVILNNLSILEKSLLFLSGVALILQESGRKLTKNVSVLTHDNASLNIFLLCFCLAQFLHV